jgi:hypothetical protein
MVSDIEFFERRPESVDERWDWAGVVRGLDMICFPKTRRWDRVNLPLHTPLEILIRGYHYQPPATNKAVGRQLTLELGLRPTCVLEERHMHTHDITGKGVI